MHASKTFFEKNPYNPKVADNMSEKESNTCMHVYGKRTGKFPMHGGKFNSLHISSIS
jgi:hypothetical protein